MGSACARSDNTPRWGARVPVPVTLHIYNLGKCGQTDALNSVLRCIGTGAFHCGVEVYGSEWSYSDVSTAHGEVARGSGVFCCPPRRCEGHTFAESVSMGKTALSEDQVLQLIRLLKRNWPVREYHTLRRNCCHFADELCEHLGVGHVPAWVMSLANTGAALVDAGDAVCCRSPMEAVWCCGVEQAAPAGAESRRAAVATTGVMEPEEQHMADEIVQALPVLPPMPQRHRSTRGPSTMRRLPPKKDLWTTIEK